MKFFSSPGGWLAFLALASAFHVCRAEKPEPNDILLFMFFGIGVGVIFMQVLNRIGDPVPFTVVVFMAGVLFSLANKDSTGMTIRRFKISQTDTSNCVPLLPIA